VWLGLDFRGWRLRLGASRALLPAAPIAPGLVPAVLLALGGGSVALTGMPSPPASGSALTGRATVPRLGPLGQEPAFTALEQALAAAGVPPAKTGWLTARQCEGKLRMAHGRTCSRAVRRREGDISRRHFAPTTLAAVNDRAARTSQLTCIASRLPTTVGHERLVRSDVTERRSSVWAGFPWAGSGLCAGRQNQGSRAGNDDGSCGGLLRARR
jgi:hypothetical protein